MIAPNSKESIRNIKSLVGWPAGAWTYRWFNVILNKNSAATGYMDSGWRGTRVSCKGKMDLSDFRGSGVFIGFARGRPYSLFAGGADIDGSCHRRQFALLQVPFLQKTPGKNHWRLLPPLRQPDCALRALPVRRLASEARLFLLERLHLFAAEPGPLVLLSPVPTESEGAGC